MRGGFIPEWLRHTEVVCIGRLRSARFSDPSDVYLYSLGLVSQSLYYNLVALFHSWSIDAFSRYILSHRPFDVHRSQVWLHF